MVAPLISFTRGCSILEQDVFYFFTFFPDGRTILFLGLFEPFNVIMYHSVLTYLRVIYSL